VRYEGLQLPIDAALQGRIALLHAILPQQGSRGHDPHLFLSIAELTKARGVAPNVPPTKVRKWPSSAQVLWRQRRLRLGAPGIRCGADRTAIRKAPTRARATPRP